MKTNSENIFISLLEALNVKHTKSFSKAYFNEHPDKNNMYGLSKMLSAYHIENQGLRIKEKNNTLSELNTPFIAYVNNDFVMVYQIGHDYVKYLWKGKKISASADEFNKNWSGIVLLAEADENTIEPDYKKHYKQEIFSSIKYILLSLSCILILSIAGFYTQLYNNFTLIPALLINLSGIYTSYLLVLKQLNIQNNQADKICSLLINQSDCNHILESDAAKFFGLSWGEIGLGYFISNFIIIIFLPSFYPYAAFINICALPYTLWSVWYQKFKAEQWCPLCLIVQGILWIFFFYNLSVGFIKLPEFTLLGILLIGCIYAIPILLLNIFNSILSEATSKEKVSQELNSIKSNEKIFNILVKSKPKYKINKTVSTILLGNLEAENLVTIISNPYCNPCASLHEKLKNILKSSSDEYCIQYIFTSFSKELEECNKLIIAMYKKLDQSDFLSFLDEWYKYGRYNKYVFFEKYPFDSENTKMQDEFNKHKEWIKQTKIIATPTILFNGYECPQNIYKIEDLTLLSDIKIS